MSEQAAEYEAYARQGRSAIWLDMGQEGATFDARPAFEQEPGGAVDLGFGAVSGNPVRERDLLLLRSILARDEEEKLSDVVVPPPRRRPRPLARGGS